MSYENVTANLESIQRQLPDGVTLVAVSKTHPPEAIKKAHETGHRIFGENKVQELVDKFEALPKDIEWHLIGHLQTNKVKYIAPFVTLIHAVDSVKLLKEINKRAKNEGRIIDVLLQVHIADESSKFGFDADELSNLVSGTVFESFENICIRGLMGMATFTDNQEQIRAEFKLLKSLFDTFSNGKLGANGKFDILSMGMSSDYEIALEERSNMIRVGSSIFGARSYDVD